MLKKITGIFGKKKEAEQASSVQGPATSPVNENGTPFLHFVEQAAPVVCATVDGSANGPEIHEFAQGGLLAHPQWNEIRGKLDKHACKKLLLSPFDIPAAFGLQITLEKFIGQQADATWLSPC